MALILGPDSYGGFSAYIDDKKTHKEGAQPLFIGRVIWPSPGGENTEHAAEDTVIKLYKASS